jgi:hypothetical protein
MQSIIADYARTKAEYLLLASIVAPVVGTMDERDIHNMFRLTLEEYRQLPD